MSYRGEPTTADAVKAFLDALATDGDLLVRYVNNRSPTITGWFEADAQQAFASVSEEAQRYLVNGDFQGVKELFAATPDDPDAECPEIWLVIWLV
jgi:hypothetical protein